eukprot:TRINITY_DN890_c0_g1_i2.p1 TRINITY_DN890_c0_g1~~TRINITY_DN890_c0_g1_i2.p1  ORF type:complete len:174 (-),score=28.88 TRINITY_DN890_c0_g1_i2:45-566(-)
MTTTSLLLALLLITLSTTFATPLTSSFCDKIEHHLPKHCNLTLCNPIKSTNIVCSVDIGSIDIIFEMDLHICADPVNIDLNLSVPSMGFEYDTEIDGSVKFPVPGLSISVYGLVDAGVYVIATVGDAKDIVDVNVGVEACASVGPFSLCEPKPPVEVYDLKLDVAGICESMRY